MSTTPTPQSDQAATTPGRAEQLAAWLEAEARYQMAYGREETAGVIAEAAALLRAQSAELLALRAALIKYSEWFGPCLGTYPEEGEKNEAWDAEAQGIDDQVAAALNSHTQKSPAK